MVKKVFPISNQNIPFSTLSLLPLAISPCILEKSGSISLCNLPLSVETSVGQTREELLLKEENGLIFFSWHGLTSCGHNRSNAGAQMWVMGWKGM